MTSHNYRYIDLKYKAILVFSKMKILAGSISFPPPSLKFKPVDIPNNIFPVQSSTEQGVRAKRVFLYVCRHFCDSGFYHLSLN